MRVLLSLWSIWLINNSVWLKVLKINNSCSRRTLSHLLIWRVTLIFKCYSSIKWRNSSLLVTYRRPTITYLMVSFSTSCWLNWMMQLNSPSIWRVRLWITLSRKISIIGSSIQSSILGWLSSIPHIFIRRLFLTLREWSFHFYWNQRKLIMWFKFENKRIKRIIKIQIAEVKNVK